MFFTIFNPAEYVAFLVFPLLFLPWTNRLGRNPWHPPRSRQYTGI